MIVESLAEAAHKFGGGVGVALRTGLLEAVGGGQGAHLTAQLQIPAVSVTGEEAAAEGIANAGGVNDLCGWDDGDMDLALGGGDEGTLAAAGDDQELHVGEDIGRGHAGQALDETDLVIVDEQGAGILDAEAHGDAGRGGLAAGRGHRSRGCPARGTRARSDPWRQGRWGR